VSETRTLILATKVLFYENILTNLRELGSLSRSPISHVKPKKKQNKKHVCSHFTNSNTSSIDLACVACHLLRTQCIGDMVVSFLYS
jgi:hypothetical protein